MVQLAKITDKKELVKHISFMIMGDGGVYRHDKTGNANYHFCMNMKAENIDYIDKCASVLGNITTTKISDVKLNNNDGCVRKEKKCLSTLSHPFFTKMHDRIYVDTYKSIDVHALKLLDMEALSYLYMSDGSYGLRDVTKIPRGKQDEHRVTLNMKRLSYGDLYILRKALEEKLNLMWNINRNGKYYYLRLRAKDVDMFMQQISPYVLPSFQYKVKEEYRMVSPESNLIQVVG